MHDRELDRVLAIPAVTVASYVCAYAFERAYVSHFRIPATLIAISLEHVICAAFFLATLCGLSLFISALAASAIAEFAFSSRPGPALVLAIFNLLAIFPTLPILYLFGWQRLDISIALVSLVILNLAMISTLRKCGGYDGEGAVSGQVEAITTESPPSAKQDFLLVLSRIVGHHRTISVMIGIFLCLLAWFGGAHIAKEVRWFPVTADNEVLIVSYGDRLILRPLAEVGSPASHLVVVRSLSDRNMTTFTWRKLVNLSVAGRLETGDPTEEAEALTQ